MISDLNPYCELWKHFFLQGDMSFERDIDASLSAKSEMLKEKS